jgi:hypothetical protein
MKYPPMAFLMLMVPFTVCAESEPQEVDQLTAQGIAALVEQPNAVRLDDISHALHLNLGDYPRSSGTYWRTAARRASDGPPILYFQFGDVVVSLAAPYMSAPPLRPTQSIKIVFDRGQCISVRTLAALTHAEFRGVRLPIMSGGSRLAEPTAVSTLQAQNRSGLGYFARITANPDRSKTQVVETTIGLDSECSQEVGISKEFDYEYWNSLCPFVYSDDFVQSAVIPALRDKYGSRHVEFGVYTPHMKDYGSTIALSFYRSAVGPNTEDEFAMEVDRCTRKVTRTWVVPAEALKDDKTP